MFVDSSAVIAILASEPEAEQFTEQIDRARTRVTSALVVFEAVTRLASLLKVDLEIARGMVLDLLAESSIELAPVDADVGLLALSAFKRYGKGRHPARLNFGDCFSYAMAKHHGLGLLYKGDDFSRTDLC